MAVNKQLVKKGRKIIGFVYKSGNDYYYAFGKPSQPSYISFKCKSFQDGKNKINKFSTT